MALILKVNGVDISSSVDFRNLALTSVLTKEVDRLEFNINKTPTKTTIPVVNDDIVILEDSVKIFGGVCVERNELIKGGVLLAYEIRCKDYSQYLDRKLVVRNYAGQTARAIVLDIISSFTSGFTTANVAISTPTVATIKFNYEQVTRCLNDLCDQIGYDWYVDNDKDIHFFAQETVVAPFNLSDTSDTYEFDTLEINNTILQLKNAIYVRGGNYKKTILEADAVDIWLGNGTQTMFPLAYQYDSITVKKGGVVQTVGVDQQTDPATVDLLYNFNEKFIKFTTPPGAAVVITVYGVALIPIIAAVRDQGSIGMYGEYQAVVVDDSITSISEAQTRALAEAKKYANSVYEGSFKTHQTGLVVGQLILITSTVRSLNKSFKINRIVGKPRTSGQMEYTVSLIASGQVSFTDIMVDLLTQNQKSINIGSAEVLQRLEFFEEEVTVADTLHQPTTSSGPYVWDTAKFNLATWG